MVNWPTVDSVFLDMDGTLLDLHFDNYFWQHHVPARYAEKHGLSLAAAQQTLFPQFRRVEGTMDWYCIDYWTEQLGLDIALLKQEVDHLIAVHPHVIDFLDAVRQAGKRMALVTNAHSKSLSLKLERTQLGGHFDAVICSHDFGVPKEDVRFWDRLQAAEPFQPARTLLVDDSLPVLKSGRAYGIGQLLAVYEPDSRGPRRSVEDFAAIDSFRDIMPPAVSTP